MSDIAAKYKCESNLVQSLAGKGAEGWVGNERFTSVVEDGVECSSCAGIILPRNQMNLISSGVFNVYFFLKSHKNSECICTCHISLVIFALDTN